MNKIEAVILPLKEDAVNRATQEAQKLVDKVTADLLAAGNDFNVCAPYPKSNRCSRPAYLQGMARVQLFRSICKSRQCTHSINEPWLADVNPEYVARFLEVARQDAAADYDAFVVKLVAKIGDVDEATLAGNHVWSFSILKVTKDGVSENWKTQQIVNVSKLGKLFNQWPTRKVK